MRTTAILILAAATAFGQAKEIRRALPLAAGGQLSLDTYKGEVRVTTWDQPQVELLARIEPDGASSESLRLANETDVRIDSTAASLQLKSDYPKQKLHLGDDAALPFVRYTIRMPRTAELRIKDYKSEIEVTGLGGALEIDTYKGDSSVHGQAGMVHMHTYKGHGTFELAQLTGRNFFDTYKGVFDITVPPNAQFDVTNEGGPKATIRSAFPFVLRAGTYNRNTAFQARVNPDKLTHGGGAELVLKSYRGEVNLH